MFSWIISHIIADIPVWIWTFVAGAGIALYFVGGFMTRFPSPQIKIIALTTKYGGLVTLLFGIFMCGGAGVTAVWQADIEAANERVAAAEAKSNKVNTVIVTKVVKQLELVRAQGDDVIKYIDREVVKYDSSCTVPAAVVNALNAAALNKPVEQDKK